MQPAPSRTARARPCTCIGGSQPGGKLVAYSSRGGPVGAMDVIGSDIFC